MKHPSVILTIHAKPETIAKKFIAESERAGFGVICANCDNLLSNHNVNIYETYNAMKDCL